MSSTELPFHTLIIKWFKENIGDPTDIQVKAWPKIAKNENVLITAPTGSGKTLAAFLWAINQLVTGKWESGNTNVLYVSPLKALNNDIRKNLIRPLEELNRIFVKEKKEFPVIRVMTRSGDTSQSDRRRMIRHPPEILITTPESLNLLLSSKNGWTILNQIKTVILDEIHSVVGNKRGVHLITAVERLVRLSGEFQRVSLSATIRPLKNAAEFVSGYRVTGDNLDPAYSPREISIVESGDKKAYQMKVAYPEKAVERVALESIWDFITEECKKIISGNLSTLIFTNSRRLCEKITYMINQDLDLPTAYAHHGSLSREIRTEVERKLKIGDLKAIVATSSLEMGIDIGDLDEVILIQSPLSISSTIQRIGRAGHQVGRASRCTLFPTHQQDFINAAVLAEAVVSQDIEEVRPVMCPLDVLSQVIISMVGVETWDIDDLFKWIRTSYPYRQLSRSQYDLVLNMLAGRYNDSRIRELDPRISIDRIDNTVAAKKGAILAVYMSGGTIPDRGYFRLRHHDTGVIIGELDEEYVWEANLGQLVTFGTQNWKIQKITHNDVFVIPATSRMMDTPFWRADELNRDFYFSSRISSFLEMLNERLNQDNLEEFLQENHFMDKTSSTQLLDFLRDQRMYTGADLPHRHHILLEIINSGPGGVPGNQVVIHTMWGGRLNRPFAMALDAAWKEKYGENLEIFPGNDCIVIQLPGNIRPEEILSLVNSGSVEELLRKRLEQSGFFGARFRECAGRALLITREKINQRMPLWMTRLRSKKLLEAVIAYDDFPLLLETWRTCLKDEFDLGNLKLALKELETGIIKWSVVFTEQPSPFASGISWNQINQYMYQLDQPASKVSSIRGDLLQEIVFSPGSRPGIPANIVEYFESKRQRLSQGYSPQEPRELLDWIKERIIITHNEWDDLLNAIERDSDLSPDVILDQVGEKLAFFQLPGTTMMSVTSLEIAPLILEVFGQGSGNGIVELLSGKKAVIKPEIDQNSSVDKTSEEILPNLLSEWMSFYGPLSMESLVSMFGLDRDYLSQVLESLLDSKDIISGRLIADSDNEYYCDSKNFEILLRLKRAEAIPQFEPLEVEYLSLFMAHFNELTRPSNSVEGLFKSLEQLLCLPLPAELWESDILPARSSQYEGSWLDKIMREGDLRWLGFENRKTAFCFEPELDLIMSGAEENDSRDEPKRETGQNKFNDISDLFPVAKSKYDFFSLMELSRTNAESLSDGLWEAVWQTKISNDTFAALRKGIENKYMIPNISTGGYSSRRTGRRRISRTGFSRWKGSLPYAGNWFRLPEVEQNEDLLDLEELKKDRVRLLLDRYGILFRELLQKELRLFSWHELFRSMRLMELSGELLAGYFFEGVSGPQFISHQAFRLLQKIPVERMVIYWINAVDPVSLCGIRIDSDKTIMPRRLPGNHLVYNGKELVLISERNGKSLTINVPFDDPDIQEYFCSLRHLLTREFKPMKYITIETINDVDAVKSPYVDALKVSFDVMLDHRKVTLYRKRQ